MFHCSKLIILASAICLFSEPSHAAYASLAPPVGWTHEALTAQSAVRLGGSATVNAATRTVLTDATLSVAGRVVNVPVAMRVAANAGTIAARASFGNPAIFLGVAAGAVAIAYWQSKGITISPSGTATITPTSPNSPTPSESAILGPTRVFAGYSFITGSDGVRHKILLYDYNFGGTVVSSGGNGIDLGPVSDDPPPPTTNVPTIDDFLKHAADFPLDGWPPSLPIPVDPTPIFNPSGIPGQPTSPGLNNPAAPYFVPTGDPVPTGDLANPYNQPGIRVTPSPTPADPWRVNIIPVDIPQLTPVPKPPEVLNPPYVPIPGIPAPQPPVNPADAAKPSETPLGLCDQYPNIEACAPAKKEFCEKNPKSSICQDLDVPDSEDIQEKTKDISVSPDTGWMNGGGSCPPPVSFRSGGAEFSYQPYCDFLAGMRPVIIAVAWLSAAFILIGAKES